jgi:hypothetical protein
MGPVQQSSRCSLQSADVMTLNSDALDPLDVVRVAASHGLPGAELAAAAEGAELLLTDDVITLARQHRVQGLLWAAVADGLIAGDHQQMLAARTAYDDAQMHCRTAVATAAEALVVLRNAEVDVRVLKGVATSRLDYSDPADRMFGDADLLIRRDDYGAALNVLTKAGFLREQPAVRGWWEQRFGKAVVFRAPVGGELDLHLAIAGGYFGARLDHEELWATASDPFDVGGVDTHGLDAEGRLLHACAHAVLGGGSGLRTMRDIAQLVLVTGADWQLVIDGARRDGCDLVVAGAVRAAWTDLGLDHQHPLLHWAAGFTPDQAQQRAFAGYTAAFDQGWAPEGHSVLAALGPLDRARFLAGLAVPSRASMNARSRTWPEHLRLGVAALRHRS